MSTSASRDGSRDNNMLRNEGRGEAPLTVAQAWGSLRKAWQGYRTAKIKGDDERMRVYAKRVNEIQKLLGVPLAAFEILRNESEAGDSRNESRNDKTLRKEGEAGITVGQAWGSLRKAWQGYRTAKLRGDEEEMKTYAKLINEIQSLLGVPLAKFDF